MESLGEEIWDAIICGTGLSQSLLALALSRSDKRILHLDPNDYYGGYEAALSLQDADSWAHGHARTGPAQSQDNRPTLNLGPNDNEPEASHGPGDHSQEPEVVSESSSNGNNTSSGTESAIFRNASVWKHPDAEAKGLSLSRAYSLALAPQIIHTRSRLLSQLVSSKAYRQVEFLAVGSFFVYDTSDTVSGPTLARIPSSREDVFSAQSIASRPKRALMKFLRFVINYDSDEQRPVWQGDANKLLSEFLVDEFKLDNRLRDSILALTLTLDGKVTVENGLATIHRHLTSMGIFGPGFCAVYPKWGGLSEIAQVGCRAGAVGGGIYMLDTQVGAPKYTDGNHVSLQLPNNVSVQTTNFVSCQHTDSTDSQAIARLVAVIDSPLQSLFEITAEGVSAPAVAVVAFPPKSLLDIPQPGSDVPLYAFVHSSDSGECPVGQSIIYLTMQAAPQSPHVLDTALAALLQAVMPTASTLYKLYYEQSVSTRTSSVTQQGSAAVFEFPSPSLGLAFDDASLDPVKEAWKLVMKDQASDDLFMKFEDREGMDGGDDDDNAYD